MGCRIDDHVRLNFEIVVVDSSMTAPGRNVHRFTVLVIMQGGPAAVCKDGEQQGKSVRAGVLR
jgi:hypothetical protein